MTEEEAMTKWCPFARSFDYASDADTAAVSVNREKGGTADPYCLCIASACMAWSTNFPGSKDGFCGLLP